MGEAYNNNWFSIAHLRWARLWLLVGCLLIAAIFYLSLSSIRMPIPQFNNIDKFMHFMAYLALMGWFVQLFHHRYGRLFVALGFIAMGVCIEFLQALNPIRHFDVLDMLANTIGVTLAWLAGFTWMETILICLEKYWIRFFSRDMAV